MGISGSKNAITERDRAVLDLKIQRDKLKQYQKKLNMVFLREQEIAKICLSKGQRNNALLALKKKKYQEQLLADVNNQLLTLHQMVDSIEFMTVQKSVFEGLKKGNQLLKQINSEMRLEDVENLVNETQEAIEYQNEISLLLNSSLSSHDQESVLEELDSLIAEQQQEQKQEQKQEQGQQRQQQIKPNKLQLGDASKDKNLILDAVGQTTIDTRDTVPISRPDHVANQLPSVPDNIPGRKIRDDASSDKSSVSSKEMVPA